MTFSIVKAPVFPEWKDAFYSINVAWLQEYFSVTPADEAQLSQPELIIENGGEILFVLASGKAVGTVALVVDQSGDVEIAKMGVLKNYRRTGLGRMLLKAAISESKALTSGIIYLETVESLVPAIRLYESFGFARAGAEHKHPLFGRTTFRMELQQ